MAKRSGFVEFGQALRPGGFAQFRRTGRGWQQRPQGMTMGTGRIVPGRQRTSGFWGIGRRAAAGANPELKFLDTDLSDATVSAVATFQNINLIAQNVTESGRVGRKCTVRSISIRGIGQLASGTVATATSAALRCRLVLDTQCNGTNITAAQLFEADTYQSFLNLANRTRFRVLWDGTFKLCSPAGGPASTTTTTYGEDLALIEYHKNGNWPLEFDNTTGAVTEIRSNNLVFVTQAAGVDGNIITTLQCRIRFSDM